MTEEHSKQYLKCATDQSKFTRISGADGHSQITGHCGDTIEIWLRIWNDIIFDATYITDGCSNARAAGCMTIELATGKTVHEALRIGQSNVIEALGGLEGEHCALLSTRTLKAAIADYFEIRHRPWEKAYR